MFITPSFLKHLLLWGLCLKNQLFILSSLVTRPLDIEKIPKSVICLFFIYPLILGNLNHYHSSTYYLHTDSYQTCISHPDLFSVYSIAYTPLLNYLLAHIPSLNPVFPISINETNILGSRQTGHIFHSYFSLTPKVQSNSTFCEVYFQNISWILQFLIASTVPIPQHSPCKLTSSWILQQLLKLFLCLHFYSLIQSLLHTGVSAVFHFHA